MDETGLSLDDFDFELPEHLIALRPAEPRGSARLVCGTPPGGISFHHIRDLPDLLDGDDLLVFNNTKVIPARLRGVRAGPNQSGQVELLLLQPLNGEATIWVAMAKPLKKLTAGSKLQFGPIIAEVLGRIDEQTCRVSFQWSHQGWQADLDEFGLMPLPPYIERKRSADRQDHFDYQPLLARYPGAVAAPTASLHFDEALMNALSDKKIRSCEVTLHVGAGTFLPVKEDVSKHKMHEEWGEVGAAAMEEIRLTKARHGRVVAVGTTVMRILETVYAMDPLPSNFAGPTNIFLKPGSQFHVCDGLVTNFHLPRSTLLMLVAGFAGTDFVQKLYREAVNHELHFFSYGDASLLWKQKI